MAESYRKTPYIEEIRFDRLSLNEFIDESNKANTESEIRKRARLIDFPTVYVVHHENGEKFSVYVGETSDIRSRTIQHLDSDPHRREDWLDLVTAVDTKMLVVGHDLFNKSLTLDVENRLMQYLSGVDAVEHLYNRRTNPQNNYYTAEKFDEVFQSIWKSLRRRNKKLFPAEEVIRNSALFKASPFHKLTVEQMDAKREIYEEILKALRSEEPSGTEETGKLILVSGEAGAGKTVLLSSLFYELYQGQSDPTEPFEFQDLDAYMCVNHLEQLDVYQAIAVKLGIMKSVKDDRVIGPSRFINQHDPENPVEVVLVDEAHLLWTQGKQGYRGKNQLKDLLKRAKVVVAVFDGNQVLSGDQFWESSELEWLEDTADSTIKLKNQMRMNAAQPTIDWVRALIHDRQVTALDVNEEGVDSEGYEIQVFDSAVELHQAVQVKAMGEGEVEKGLSRLVATYDWPYSKKNEGTGKDGMWTVKIGDNFELPWNYELKSSLTRAEKRAIQDMAWAEQSHTINEVGSTYTIQGFDLNYVGVIIGPSVKFRDGKVVIDPSEKMNKQVTNRRTLKDGKKVSVAESLIQNELNVLLSRGVNGLYIYAVDNELRAALMEATQGGKV